MKISFNWIKQFIDINWTVEKTSELLTNLGLEVEGVEPYQSIKGGLEGVVVGKVITCVPHPNADKLKLTTVSIGIDKDLPIVCGAPNVDVNQKVLVATIGTHLRPIDGTSFLIKKSKIRGEESFGMICAEDELGIGKSHDGILVLDETIEVGTPASAVFEVENDFIFDIGLTPNRADAMSHLGVARDLKAGLLQEKIDLPLNLPLVSDFKADNNSKPVALEVQDKDLAPFYCGVTISDVTVTDSPTWIQNRLKSIGLKPINNIVDVTNYVMHELGQPLHAFDTNQINGHKIIVKKASSETPFTTLDEVSRKLDPEDLTINDTEKPLCIAGVFGGLHSGVTTNTKSIFLESAYFDPISIRKTAKRHALNTDASFRYERGIDPYIGEYALKRAALLIKEVTGGKISSDIVYSEGIIAKDFKVTLSFENTRKLIGKELPKETITSILSSLDIEIIKSSENGLELLVPAYRNDVQREVDVIEEILRIYGYNNIPSSKKLNTSIVHNHKNNGHYIQNVASNYLASIGFYEILSNSLTSPKYQDLSNHFHDKHKVTLLNPLSNDLSVLRQSLLFSGLEAIAHNVNRKRSDLKFFEFGKTYHNYPNHKEEIKHLSLLITGNQNQESWNTELQKSSFFYLKGYVISILERLGVNDYTSQPTKNSLFREGLQLVYKQKSIVEFGILNKDILDVFEISQDVFFADFNWSYILEEILKQTPTKFDEISKQPEVRRDFSLLLDKNISFEDIYTQAKKTEKKLLKNINLFDVYEGKSLPKGKKSYAISFIIQDQQKTLTEKQIDKVMTKLHKNFEHHFGAELR